MSSTNNKNHHQAADPYKEKNIDDASIKEKIQDLVEFIDSCKFGIMTTHDARTSSLVSRCMAIAAKECGGIDLIFLTNTETGKINDIKNNPNVNISFLDSSGQWASFSGTSSIVTETDYVKKYYSSSLKAWLGDLGDGKHDGSSNDPRVGIIRFESKTITYVINSKNALSRGLEVAQSVITRNAPEIHKLRVISEQEVTTWRTSKKMIE